jgi:hypothetical protein
LPCPIPDSLDQGWAATDENKPHTLAKEEGESLGEENPQAFFIVSALGLLMLMNTLLSLGALTVTRSHWGVNLEGGKTRGKSSIGLLKRWKRALMRAQNLSVSCSTERPTMRMALLTHTLLG